jgi:hypothetical protein
MPNRFTAVPTAPAPALGVVARLVLPAADLFMLAMLSRPRSGSLRNTWVTPATLWLAAGTSAIGLALAVLLFRRSSGVAFAAGVVACLLFAGSISVVVVALDQRRHR